MNIESSQRRYPSKEELLKMLKTGEITVVQGLVRGLTFVQIADQLKESTGQEKGPLGVERTKQSVGERFSSLGKSAGIYRAIFLLAREGLISVSVDSSHLNEDQPTDLEFKVLSLAALGCTDKEIGQELRIDHRQANRQKRSLCHKLGTRGNFYAVVAWYGVETRER